MAEARRRRIGVALATCALLLLPTPPLAAAHSSPQRGGAPERAERLLRPDTSPQPPAAPGHSLPAPASPPALSPLPSLTPPAPDSRHAPPDRHGAHPQQSTGTRTASPGHEQQAQLPRSPLTLPGPSHMAPRTPPDAPPPRPGDEHPLPPGLALPEGISGTFAPGHAGGDPTSGDARPPARPPDGSGPRAHDRPPQDGRSGHGDAEGDGGGGAARSSTKAAGPDGALLPLPGRPDDRPEPRPESAPGKRDVPGPHPSTGHSSGSGESGAGHRNPGEARPHRKKPDDSRQGPGSHTPDEGAATGERSHRPRETPGPTSLLDGPSSSEEAVEEPPAPPEQSIGKHDLYSSGGTVSERGDEAREDGEENVPTQPSGQVLPVLPLGAGMALIGLGLAFLALLLRRG